LEAKYTKRRSSVDLSVLSVIRRWLADSQLLSTKATGEVSSRPSTQHQQQQQTQTTNTPATAYNTKANTNNI
jgi:hypothetical protein